MSMSRFAACVSAAAVLASAGLVAGSAAAADVPAPVTLPGTLLGSAVDGNLAVWTPATGARKVLAVKGYNRIVDGKFSPDGKRVAFSKNATGGMSQRDIFTVPAAGGAQTRVTTSASKEVWPTWSPDGKKLAFYSDRDNRDNIYLLNSVAPFGAVVPVTNSSSPARRDGVCAGYTSESYDKPPVWRPGSQEIAVRGYCTTASASVSVAATVTPAGTLARTIASGPVPGPGWVVADWSVDGTKAVLVDRLASRLAIYTVATKATKVILNKDPGSGFAPESVVLSPDGKWIAAASSVDTTSTLYPVAGGAPMRLPSNFVVSDWKK